MVQQDRVRNYGAIGTGFAFLGFFYELLGILEDQHNKKNSGPVQPVHHTGLTGQYRFNRPPQAVRPLTASGARQSRAPLGMALRRRRSRRRGAGQRPGRAGTGPVRVGGPRARSSSTRACPRVAGDEQAVVSGGARRRGVFPVTAAHKLKGEGVREME